MENSQVSTLNSFLVWLIIIVSTSQARGKMWPDLSCQEKYENELSKNGTASHMESWERCRHPTNETGQCAKVCQLKSHEILTFYGSTELIRFEPLTAAKYYRDELGIQGYDPEDQKAVSLNRNILVHINVCDKKCAVIRVKGLIRTKTFLKWDIMGPCDQWQELLECLDKAYKGGCKPDQL